MDMYGVVILFDELDALVQKRGGDSQDTESTFLTTYMLPKLAKLHDAGRSIFLMATNFEERFDDAIKRAGRFDMLLCMGPPTLEEKCKNFDVFLDKGKETQAAGDLILEWSNDLPEIYDRLTLYTFGEFKTFLVSIGTANDIHDRLTKLGKDGFKNKVLQDATSVGLRYKDLKMLQDRDFSGTYSPSPWVKLSDLYCAELNESEITKKVTKDETPTPPAIRYILERKRSKFQY
jgi:SpoVK/Ycf46/Vps4 family AAA+-type ATPase